MKLELRGHAECGDEKQVELKGWTKKRKRGPRLRFSSSKAQRRAKRKVLQESTAVEGNDRLGVLNLGCMEVGPRRPVVQIGDDVSTETRTAEEECENRVPVTWSCIPVDQGELRTVQEGSSRGQSCAILNPTSQSDPRYSAAHRELESGVFVAVCHLSPEIHLIEGMNCEDSDTRKGPVDSTARAMSHHLDDVTGQSVSPSVFSISCSCTCVECC